VWVFPVIPTGGCAVSGRRDEPALTGSIGRLPRACGRAGRQCDAASEGRLRAALRCRWPPALPLVSLDASQNPAPFDQRGSSGRGRRTDQVVGAPSLTDRHADPRRVRRGQGAGLSGSLKGRCPSTGHFAINSARVGSVTIGTPGPLTTTPAGYGPTTSRSHSGQCSHQRGTGCTGTDPRQWRTSLIRPEKVIARLVPTSRAA
jgi:hypothetical protein